MVVPTGNLSPELSGEQVAVSGPSTLSIAVTVNVSTFPVGSVVASVMLLGTVTTGFVVSCTVTLNDAVDVLPALSAALQVTTVLAIGNVEPEAGVQPKLASPEPPGSSVAVAV